MSNNSREREYRRRSALGKELAPLPNLKDMLKTTELECVECGGLSPVPKHASPDKGRAAMLFMVSAFTIEALLWGFPLASAGVFNAFYNQQPNFQNDRYLAVVGTLGTGIPFLGAPLITPLTARYHKYQRHMIWTGWAICMGSLIAASFSTKVWHLILTQGLLYGIGFLVLYYALLSMLNEWFVERRGLAYGILFAAAGLSGSGLPFLLEIVLNKYGYAVTLRGYAVAVLVLIGPTLPFCVGRIPYSDQVQTSRKVAFKSVLTNPIFHILSISNLFQGLAFYLPGLYLSLYAETLHISPIRSTLLICLLNLAQVVGQIALGWLSDCSDIFTLLLVSTVGSAIPCCVLWYTATEIKHLIAFSVVYGIFAGGYSVFYPRFVTILTSDPATGLWLYGLLAFGRGVGNVVAGPLSAEILGFMDGKSAHPDQAASYRYLIIYVGAAFLISAFGALGYFWRDRTLTPNRPDCIIRLRQRRKPSQASSHMNFTT